MEEERTVVAIAAFNSASDVQSVTAVGRLFQWEEGERVYTLLRDNLKECVQMSA